MQDDMAKIGWLYLNKGKWGQKQIVPGPWVEASTRGHIDANPGDQYGYHWWMKNDGNYSAVGYKSQFIFVEREKNMVVVFTGDLPGGTFFIPMELGQKFFIPAGLPSGIDRYSYQSFSLNFREYPGRRSGRHRGRLRGPGR